MFTGRVGMISIYNELSSFLEGTPYVKYERQGCLNGLGLILQIALFMILYLYDPSAYIVVKIKNKANFGSLYNEFDR